MPSERTIRELKRLIWIYFWLLIFEGALRKWFLRSLANPLLVVRDPILLWLYFRAMGAGLFPNNGFVRSTIVLAFIAFATSLFAAHGNMAVTLFGIRTSFLHIPLIFLIPKLFDIEDVKRMGRWTLAIAIPMTLLLVMQFMASPDHFLNRGTGEAETGGQLMSALGKIRTSGTFAFITGPALFYPLVTAFLLYGIVIKKTYRFSLIFISTISLIIAIAVSGSRSVVMNVLMVLIMIPYISFQGSGVVSRAMKFIIPLALIYFIVTSMAIFRQGIDVMGARFEVAGGLKKGGLDRIISSFLSVFGIIPGASLFGEGIGMGTNAGAALLTGGRTFLLAEGEWDRAVLESGMLFGPLYILLRILIVLYLWRVSVKAIKEDNNVLPILIFGASALNIMMGQWGPPTPLGFAVLCGGLCLAACRIRPAPDEIK